MNSLFIFFFTNTLLCIRIRMHSWGRPHECEYINLCYQQQPKLNIVVSINHYNRQQEPIPSHAENFLKKIGTCVIKASVVLTIEKPRINLLDLYIHAQYN